MSRAGARSDEGHHAACLPDGFLPHATQDAILTKDPNYIAVEEPEEGDELVDPTVGDLALSVPPPPPDDTPVDPAE
eukprot:731301-Pyramimonas_sp.AAC.1